MLIKPVMYVLRFEDYRGSPPAAALIIPTVLKFSDDLAKIILEYDHSATVITGRI